MSDATSRTAQEAARLAREGHTRLAADALAQGAEAIDIPPLRFIADLKGVTSISARRAVASLSQMDIAADCVLSGDDDRIAVDVSGYRLGLLRAPEREQVRRAREMGVAYQVRIIEISVRDGEATAVIELSRGELHDCGGCGLPTDAAFALCTRCRSTRTAVITRQERERPIPADVAVALRDIARSDDA